MKTEGTPGNVMARWSGGMLQLVNKNSGVVIFAVDPSQNRALIEDVVVEQASMGETQFLGRIFVPSGEILASADEINDAGRYSHYQKIYSGDIGTAATADDIVFYWPNNLDSKDAIVTRVIFDITKAGGTATATLDIGGASSPIVGSANILTGATVDQIAVYDSLDTYGVVKSIKVPDGHYVTAQVKTEKAASLEGTCTIYYITP